MQRLPDDSLTAALASNSKDRFGWSVDREILASIFDAINLNTRATGNWEKSPPKFPMWPRPGARSDSPAVKPKSTMQALYAKFAGGAAK